MGKFASILMWLGSKRFLRFIPVSPEFWTEFRVTTNCNSRCTTCFAWKNKSVDELTTEEAKDALHQLREIGIKVIVFLGGEPLLRRDIGELLSEATLLKFESRIVVTNGLLLENKAEELVENGATHVTVSIDGYGSTNDIIRGVPGNFEKAIRGIEALKTFGKAKGIEPKITILTTILMEQNVDDVPKLVELSRNLGVFWSFNLLDQNVDIFNGIPFTSLLISNPERIDKTIDYIRKARDEYPRVISPDVSCDHMLKYAKDYLKGKNRFDFHCIHGFKMVHLGPHGEVYPGCWAAEPVGTLRESKLRDITSSKEYRERVERMYLMQCPGCTNRFQHNVAMKHLLSHQLEYSRLSKM